MSFSLAVIEQDSFMTFERGIKSCQPWLTPHALKSSNILQIPVLEKALADESTHCDAAATHIIHLPDLTAPSPLFPQVAHPMGR